MILFTMATAQTVRLIGGDGPYEGRLEVNYDGSWGTVALCDGSFDDAAARVVCYMLGYGHNGRFIGNRYGAGSGKILLAFFCIGTERNIADCSYRGWGEHDCIGRHSDAVSVSCITVRLAGPSSSQEGRLEVLYNDTWGTVCGEGFTHVAAGVVCHMLGYGRAGRIINNRNGAGNGKIWLDGVQCNGRETNIADCQHNDWGDHSCSHSEDVSVSCPSARLVGGSSQEGRLEVFHDGIWGTVCDGYFNDAAARVVCHMLGYSHFGHFLFLSHRYGAGSGQIWLDDVQCSGMERNIADCQHNDWGDHNCEHSEDVSVSCMPSTVRLVEGPSPQEGRLEVLHDGIWGTVCGDYFNDAAARIVCLMLGYGNFGHFLSRSYGAGSGQIWLDDVQCNGTETDIADCQHNGWGVHNCDHDEDVSVSCSTVRLVGGPSPQEGRLEVRYKGIWGTVCDDYFDNAAAKVVCHMLGYKHTGQFIGNRYAAGNGTIWLDEVDCDGTERHISECSHTAWGFHHCEHHEDVSVSCRPTTVRLVEGSSSQEGRLEVFHDGIWGTVCGDYFNDVAARIVCLMLGYGYFGHFLSRRYGAGSGQIWLDDVQCNGTETDIADCQHNDWGIHNCDHNEDVSVSCSTLRLVGGPSPQEGRLEVRYKGIWGTVCDDYFDNAAARVVCHMLGYKQTGRFIGNRYGAGNGTIWLDDIRCDGTERHISQCSHGAWGFHHCEHHEDVSVSCVDGSSLITEIVIAVVVVIVVGLVVRFHRYPHRQRADRVMIPIPVSDTTDNSTQTSDNDAHNDFLQHSSAPAIAGAVGDVGPGDTDDEETAMYESLSNDQGQL